MRAPWAEARRRLRYVTRPLGARENSPRQTVPMWGHGFFIGLGCSTRRESVGCLVIFSGGNGSDESPRFHSPQRCTTQECPYARPNDSNVINPRTWRHCSHEVRKGRSVSLPTIWQCVDGTPHWQLLSYPRGQTGSERCPRFFLNGILPLPFRPCLMHLALPIGVAAGGEPVATRTPPGPGRRRTLHR